MNSPESKDRQRKRPRKATVRGRILPHDTRPGREQLVAEPERVPVPVTIAEHQRRPSGEVIVPVGVKRTVAPVRPGRFEASGPVIGGFATMRPGEYLAEAGFSGYLDEQS